LVNGYLTGQLNRKTDLATGGHFNRRRFIVPAPSGDSNDQFIVALLQDEQTYEDTASVKYILFPVFARNEYNSNSYVVGILKAITGVNYGKRLPWTSPGRGEPVPTPAFESALGINASVDSVDVSVY
jgi:hypothetical protein